MPRPRPSPPQIAAILLLNPFTKLFPVSSPSFLKLCKIKYYNFAPVHSVQKDFSFQTGDPLGPDAPGSDGGSSIWGVLDGPSKRTFPIDIPPKMKHTERGTVSLATVPSPNDPDQRVAGSQFLITLGDNLDYLDGKAAIFGKVVEGFDVLEKINGSFVDDRGRPLKDIRIRHTVVLDDPFDDPAGLVEPPESPLPTKAQLDTVRIADDEELDEEMDEAALEKLRREREARAQALTLEMVGDLPFADVKPPENVLFVCKLNPVTQGLFPSHPFISSSLLPLTPSVDEDLQLIFSRFGTILSCEVIRDKRTGDSLQYAFVEFENQKDCEQAYFKMQGVLIDDHRIHVDFSQSVSVVFRLVYRFSQSALEPPPPQYNFSLSIRRTLLTPEFRCQNYPIPGATQQLPSASSAVDLAVLPTLNRSASIGYPTTPMPRMETGRTTWCLTAHVPIEDHQLLQVALLVGTGGRRAVHGAIHTVTGGAAAALGAETPTHLTTGDETQVGVPVVETLTEGIVIASAVIVDAIEMILEITIGVVVMTDMDGGDELAQCILMG